MVILTTFPPPTDGIKVLQPNTMAHVGSKSFGKGTLYIAESRLSWVGDTGPGFSLEYPAISMHAVSRDLTAYPHECLYLMIDGNLSDAGMDSGATAHELNDDEEHDNISEIRFVPDDKDILQAMYHAMTECQSLHPDQEDNSEEDDDWNGDGEDEEEEDYEDEGGDDFSVETTPNGLRLSRGNGAAGDENLPMETGQFEDAEP